MMSYRHEVQSSNKVEVISVRDDHYDQPHFLLLLITESATVDTTHERRYLDGKIEIRAQYLFGPLSREIGRTVCHMGGETSFPDAVRLSNGDILLHVNEMRGLNVASFMFNRIVRWAKCLEADRKVRPLMLVKQDANDIRNKARRNQLYRKFGIPLVFQDPATEAEGHSAHDLVTHDLLEFSDREWANISVNNWLEGFRELYGDQKKARERLRQNTRMLAYYRRRSERFDEKVSTVQRALHSLVNWPLMMFTAIAAYSVGSSEWRTYAASAMRLIGF